MTGILGSNRLSIRFFLVSAFAAGVPLYLYAGHFGGMAGFVSNVPGTVGSAALAYILFASVRTWEKPVLAASQTVLTYGLSWFLVGIVLVAINVKNIPSNIIGLVPVGLALIGTGQGLLHMVVRATFCRLSSERAKR